MTLQYVGKSSNMCLKLGGSRFDLFFSPPIKQHINSRNFEICIKMNLEICLRVRFKKKFQQRKITIEPYGK